MVPIRWKRFCWRLPLRWQVISFVIIFIFWVKLILEAFKYQIYKPNSEGITLFTATMTLLKITWPIISSGFPVYLYCLMPLIISILWPKINFANKFQNDILVLMMLQGPGHLLITLIQCITKMKCSMQISSCETGLSPKLRT